MLGTNGTNTEWNTERFALLLELNGKISNSRIAATINAQTGSNFSRNAIIGKRAREGLLAERQKRQATPKPAPAEFLGKTLLELGDGECRYPRGDKPFLFCGQPVKEDSSYCPACYVTCHERMTPERQRDRAKIIRYLETLR